MSRLASDPTSALRIWWLGARPRTLGASAVPVLVGTAAAADATAWRTVGALVVALGLQVGVNYVNDYFDGVRGVDSPARTGPVRLTASRLATPRAVAVAAGVSLAAAAISGLALALAVQPWLLAVGGAAMLAAVLYSGGPRPYGAMGLGEAAVFLFFGLVATCGTAYVQAEHVPARAWWGGVAVGLLAVAILVVNNLRDIPTDAASGKRTLAVRLGEGRTRRLYGALVVAALTVPIVGVAAGGLPIAALMALGAAPLAARPLRLVGRARGGELIPALVGTAALHAAVGLLLAVGLWLS